VARVLRRVSLAEALEAVFAHTIKVVGVERIGMSASAAGRVLAEDVRAQEDVPPFTRSSVDGFAVIADDVRGATPTAPALLHVTGEVLMGGSAPAELHRGEALRVPTGGALPRAATGVVKKEDCGDRGGEVDVLDGAGCEEHMTQRGADVKRGDVLRRRGDVLTAASIGLLSGSGVADLHAYATPSIGLLVTGDEIVSPGAPMRLGEVRDINSLSLAAALRAMGFAPHPYPRVPDRRDAFDRAFRQALDECDGVVISGGSSVGERDYTPAVVAAAGSPGVIVHGVRAKPGRPTMLGIVGTTPVVGLAGNPVSALVMLEMLGRPMLLKLYDKRDDRLAMRARLTEGIDVDPSLEHIVPVSLSRAHEGLTARPLLGTSAQMHILGFADALVRVVEGHAPLAAGTWVDALPLSRNIDMR
jgi:molybdopterin molybdotransferase